MTATMKKHIGRTVCARFSQFYQFIMGFLVATALTFVVMINSRHVRTNIPESIFSVQAATRACCGPQCRDLTPPSEGHYNEKYFNWQTAMGKKKAAKMNWNKFLGTNSSQTVADLGAGGGHILATLNVSRRIAVEISETARAGMESVYPNMIEKYKYPEDVPNDIIDILLTTSAIEHFECPLTELREMARKVKVGGKAIVGIKNEGAAFARPARGNDIDQHYYTWGHQQLYNLVRSAGFHVDEISPHVDDVMQFQSRYFGSPEHFASENAKIYLWLRATKIKPTS